MAAFKDRRERSRARETQLSGLIVAGLTVITLIALTGLFEDLPEAPSPRS